MTETPPMAAAARLQVPRPLEAVVFDMDGLLLDSERLHRVAMHASGSALGFAVDDALFARLVGVPREGNRAILAEHFGPRFPLDAFFTDADARFDALSRGGVPWRPGVAAILDYLRDTGIRCAVATSTRAPWAQQRLAAAGLLDRFETVVTRSDVARPKPDPEPYLLAAHRLGARPAQCIALEDSYSGVRSAAAAGMTTIMIPDLLPPTAETAALAAATLPGLADVVDALVGERAA